MHAYEWLIFEMTEVSLQSCCTLAPKAEAKKVWALSGAEWNMPFWSSFLQRRPIILIHKILSIRKCQFVCLFLENRIFQFVCFVFWNPHVPISIRISTQDYRKYRRRGRGGGTRTPTEQGNRSRHTTTFCVACRTRTPSCSSKRRSRVLPWWRSRECSSAQTWRRCRTRSATSASKLWTTSLDEPTYDERDNGLLLRFDVYFCYAFGNLKILWPTFLTIACQEFCFLKFSFGKSKKKKKKKKKIATSKVKTKTVI